MRFDILTIFPELFPAFFSASLLGKATNEGLLSFQVHNIRDFATDKHKTVDDTPYGGGAGMVMKIEPIDKTLQELYPPDKGGEGGFPSSSKIIVLSARGQQFTQAKAAEYAQFDQLILICGRYEGIDQRVADHLADEEISIGPYVLNGGEVAAMAIIEATARLIPGVLGNEESLREESFAVSSPDKGRLGGVITGETIEYPQYTKPAEYKEWKVPEVLLSGNHEEVRKWRMNQQKTITKINNRLVIK